MTLNRILLHNVSEDMILARDVVDQYGRALLVAGMPLKQEIVKLLEKHEVVSVFVRDREDIHTEIELTRDLVSMETRLKLISSVKNTFSQSTNLAANLVQLQSYVEDVVDTLSKSEHVCLYLNDIECANEYLFMHSVNVGLFSIVIGMAMDFSHEELCLLGMGGILHDLGKTKIPAAILDKQGKLTMDEFNEIKEHSSLGYNMLKSDAHLDYRIMFMALQHHERCNGSGYPWGIPKNKIHPLARIVAVADVYDALTSNRVYRSPLTFNTPK